MAERKVKITGSEIPEALPAETPAGVRAYVETIEWANAQLRRERDLLAEENRRLRERLNG